MPKSKELRIKFNLLNFNQEMLCELNKIGVLLYSEVRYAKVMIKYEHIKEK